MFNLRSYPQIFCTADTPQNHESDIEEPILISDEFNNKTAYKCNQYNKSVRLFVELASKRMTGFAGTYKYMTFLRCVI